MKFCPICQTRYDEEILRFCTKDGTPLVEEDQPNFTALPSETSDEDDFGEETVIRRNPPQNIEPEAVPAPPERILIPTAETAGQEVRAQAAPVQREPPQRSNTATVVLMTILGTLAAIGLGAGAFWLLSDRSASEANVNQSNANANADVNTNADANFNTDLFSNSNVNADANFNANVNANVNTNANVNANLKTPSPTRTPSPTPSPDETPNESNTNSNANAAPANTNTDTRPSPSPTSTTSPRPTTSPTAPSNVNVGVMNSRAVSLPKPAYPQTARQVGASGQVAVAVTVDEGGNVLTARAVSGHPLLRVPAEAAARQSRFNPVKIGEQTVRANGILVYNFINQ